MLGALVISPDMELANELIRVLMAGQDMAVLRVVQHYPSALELQRILRASAPEVLFVSVDNSLAVFELLQSLEANAPHIQIVAMSRNVNPNLLLDLMRSGIREFLPPPFSADLLRDLSTRLRSKVTTSPGLVDTTELLYCFLPAKAGVGATTVAVNVAHALAHEINLSTLLSDFDLNSGIIKFMLKLNTEHTVRDAVDRAGDLDENLWPQLVSTMGKLDVLHAGPMNPGHRLDLQQLRQWVAFARRHYKAICCDLSGNMEKYSLELMQEAKQILLVCTPEIPSLHLADEKVRFLRRIDLGDRITLILNRAQKKSIISDAEIEKLLGIPVSFSLPNDYVGVHRALTAGCHVAPSSALGKQFSQLARTLAESMAPSQEANTISESQRRRLSELFTLGRTAPAAERATERLALPSPELVD